MSLFCVLAFSPLRAAATPDYARQTGFACTQCHVDAVGGGALTREGENFLSGLKSQGLYRPLSAVQHVVRLFIGYFHMLAAIAWFGTIMYVHILLKPAYASKGLPKGELKHRGRAVDPTAIRDTALLAIEGERDDICAVGQTAAAHDLCTGLRPYLKRHHMQAGVGHYGVFSGNRWTSQIYPLVKNVILASE